MSRAVHVKTLTIDGRDVGAREDETILDVARENSIFIPTLCDSTGLSDVGRVPAVPGGGRRAATSCCRPASRGWQKAWRSRPIPSGCASIAADPRTAVRGAQSRVFRLRLQRTLRTAVLAQKLGMTMSTSRTAIRSGRWMPPTSGSSWITTGASSARAACGCAMRSKAPTPGT